MDLSVAFTNGQDGFVRLKTDPFSEFQSGYEATVTGYQQKIAFKYDRTRTKVLCDEKLGGDEYLAFRVRTQVDGSGTVTNAKYGKLYGPLEFGVGKDNSIRFSSYLNPTNNDRNIEFAPGQNLFEEIDMTRVVAP
jgi:hypothetical protein